MKYKDKVIWVPADGKKLEPTAFEAVQSNENLLVVAGPGAGKTELLAQRACYLLETNECKWPKRILAISFKRDAASNIKERVKKRCGEELAERFDSFTFDAFANFILNHFYQCLPEGCKINQPYDIIGERDIVRLYEQNFPAEVAHIQENELLNKHHQSLPVNRDKMAFEIWRLLLNARPSKLSFRMVMRLAHLIVETNENVKRIIQNTYSHIFLDEFQDTTSLQYDFLNTCFDGCHVVLTAVGDDKQKIMGWAGAKSDIFSAYIDRYNAGRKELQMNFRSAPNLVKLQNYLIKKLLKKSTLMIASDNHTENGSAYLYKFSNAEKECDSIIDLINDRMNSKGLKPRDFCILVKQQVNVYPKNFYDKKTTLLFGFRNEDPFSQRLEDPVFSFFLNSLLLSKNKANAKTIESIYNFLMSLSYSVDDEKNSKYQRSFEKIIQDNRNEENVKTFVDNVISFVGKEKISRTYPDYRNTNNIELAKLQLDEWVQNRITKGMSFVDALIDIRGDNSIPIMTIHKSKGLEYDTVVFLGLEDNPFRNMGTPNSEDENAFFVALSRAKNQVIFTFCQQRLDGRGNNRIQTKNNIGQLYDILEQSGLVEFR